MNAPPRELADLLRRHDPAVRELAMGLRAAVVSVLAPVHEYIFPMRSKLVLLYSTTDRVIADGVCHIGVFTRHVTLVFVNGVELDDPTRVLCGSGKMMRHVVVKSQADLTRREIRALLRDARRKAGIRRDAGRPDVVTRIKPSSPAKQVSEARKPPIDGLGALGFSRGR
jgi:hypothetical protein